MSWDDFKSGVGNFYSGLKEVPVLGSVVKGVEGVINGIGYGIEKVGTGVENFFNNIFGINGSASTVNPDLSVDGHGGLALEKVREIQELNNQASLMMALQQQEASQSSAREAMNFSADQAQLARDFQERMSNTAYQRAVADMKAAGINPALAYQQGGASTPAGFAASGNTASMAEASVDNDTIKSILSQYLQSQTAVQVSQGDLLVRVLSALLPTNVVTTKK